MGAKATGARRVAVINGSHPNGWALGLAGAGTACDAGAPLLLVTPDVTSATVAR